MREVVTRIQVFRIYFQRAHIALQRLFWAAEIAQRDAAVVRGFRLIRPHAQGIVIALQGFIKAFKLLQHIRTIVDRPYIAKDTETFIQYWLNERYRILL